MLDDIRKALGEVAQDYADTRIAYCRVEAAAIDAGRCTLTGAVLDRRTLAAVLAGLAARLPIVQFDPSGVRVLRSAAPQTRAVGVNLTGLYAKPSFLAEMVSELLNGWPLEVLLTEGRWSFVRQTDGYLGWAYAPYLADAIHCTFTHLVCEPVSLLTAGRELAAPVVSRVLGGTAVMVDAVQDDWAHVALAGGPTTGEHQGWLPCADLRAFGQLPADEAARREQIVADSHRFTGVPYLWGGCTALGIDCSGFAQLLHRLAGVTLPRDADMQYAAGRPVSEPYQRGDLLFFGEVGDLRKITHVGASLGGWRIIHSSRSRNGVYEDDVQAVEHLRESFAGARSFV